MYALTPSSCPAAVLSAIFLTLLHLCLPLSSHEMLRRHLALSQRPTVRSPWPCVPACMCSRDDRCGLSGDRRSRTFDKMTRRSRRFSEKPLQWLSKISAQYSQVGLPASCLWTGVPSPYECRKAAMSSRPAYGLHYGMYYGRIVRAVIGLDRTT